MKTSKVTKQHVIPSSHINPCTLHSHSQHITAKEQIWIQARNRVEIRIPPYRHLRQQHIALQHVLHHHECDRQSAQRRKGVESRIRVLRLPTGGRGVIEDNRIEERGVIRDEGREVQNKKVLLKLETQWFMQHMIDSLQLFLN